MTKFASALWGQTEEQWFKVCNLFVLATPLINHTGRWLHWERNLALRSIHTRRFLDPDPPRVVDNPERILRRGSIPADKGISHLHRASSLPTESVKCLTSFDFDKETDQSFPRSRSETELCQVLTGPERPNTSRPTQQPSHSSPTPAVQNPVLYSIAFVPPFIPTYTVVFPNPPIVMAAIFCPLYLPS